MQVLQRFAFRGLVNSLILLLTASVVPAQAADDQRQRADDANDEVGPRFAIYDDGHNAGFIPSGWMPDGSGLAQSVRCTDSPRSGKYCVRTKCRLADCKEGWAGIAWLLDGQWFPRRGLNLFERIGAKQGDPVVLRFWARSKKQAWVEFSAGGGHGGSIVEKQFACRGALTPQWQRFQIDLTYQDLSHVVQIFASSVNSSSGPAWLRELSGARWGILTHEEPRAQTNEPPDPKNPPHTRVSKEVHDQSTVPQNPREEGYEPLDPKNPPRIEIPQEVANLAPVDLRTLRAVIEWDLDDIYIVKLRDRDKATLSVLSLLAPPIRPDQAIPEMMGGRCCRVDANSMKASGYCTRDKDADAIVVGGSLSRGAVSPGSAWVKVTVPKDWKGYSILPFPFDARGRGIRAASKNKGVFFSVNGEIVDMMPCDVRRSGLAGYWPALMYQLPSELEGCPVLGLPLDAEEFGRTITIGIHCPRGVVADLSGLMIEQLGEEILFLSPDEIPEEAEETIAYPNEEPDWRAIRAMIRELK